MARPKLNSDDIPVRHRLELAFWELLKDHPAREITVNMIVSRADCARGSFYYHFEDIDCLIDNIIERSIPTDVPRVLYNWFFVSRESTPDMLNDPVLRERLDKLCFLVGPNSTLDITSKVKQGFISAWLKLFGVDEASISFEAKLLLDFMSNGVLGIISYRSYHGMDIDIEHYLNVVYPDIPEAFMRRLTAVMGVAPKPVNN